MRLVLGMVVFGDVRMGRGMGRGIETGGVDMGNGDVFRCGWRMGGSMEEMGKKSHNNPVFPAFFTAFPQ